MQSRKAQTHEVGGHAAKDQNMNKLLLFTLPAHK